MNDQFFPILLSIKCGIFSALINLPWGVFWGWVFARKNFRGKLFVQCLLYLPLVLPPVLTGYFLLLIFSKKAFLGQLFYSVFQTYFVLDWKGTVIAASVVSSPFMILTIKNAIEKVDPRLEFAAQNLGANFYKVFSTITLPLSWQGIVAGLFLVFARSIGEFGATIILAGNIPGKTQTIPLAIYSHVYLGQELAMIPLVMASIGLSYVGLVVSQKLTQPLSEKQ